MTVEHHDAEGLHEPRGYRHASVASGTRTVHCAGQVSMDASGAVVAAGDYTAQAQRALHNVVTALAAAGAQPEHVVKITYYVVGMTPDIVAEVNRGLGRAAREVGLPAVPATMVGVTALSLPELLIEADAVAILP